MAPPCAVATASDTSGSMSGSMDEGPPDHSSDALTMRQLKKLGAGRNGEVYGRGVVDSPRSLAERLGTSLRQGLCEDEAGLAARAALYGSNAFPEQDSVSFRALVMEALQDFTVLTLVAAGSVSLLLSFLVSSRLGGEGSGLGDGGSWVEGASILASVAVVVAVGAGNNWQKERQFQALQALQRDHTVRAIRNGAETVLGVQGLLVGDVLLVETGDILGVDGVLIAGADLRLDQSALTGEACDVHRDPNDAPFLLSGSAVVGGTGRMLVTAVGENSASGAISRAIMQRKGTGGTGALREPTQLQMKLEVYATTIGKFGVAAASVATFASLAHFGWTTFVLNGQPWDWIYAKEILDALIVGITILVVAVPEGLPLAVTLSLAFSVKQMLAENNLVRQLQASETMGTTTVICSDKTGTLTKNKMVLSSVWMSGVEVTGLATSWQLPTRRAIQRQSGGDVASLPPPSPPGTAFDAVRGRFSARQLELLRHGIVLNCDCNIYYDEEGVLQEVGSGTEVALMRLALQAGTDSEAIRSGTHILARIPFSYVRKRSSVVVYGEGERWRTSGKHRYFKEPNVAIRAYTKGAPEMVLERCKWQLAPDGTRQPLDVDMLDDYLRDCQQAGQRTVALAFRDVEVPSHVLTRFKFALTRSGSGDDDDWQVDLSQAEDLEQDMILLGVCAIEDPLRPEVPAAIAAARKAGIWVKMLTGDNLVTAAAIASQAGILPRGTIITDLDAAASAGAGVNSLSSMDGTMLHPYAVMDGEEFRSKVLTPTGAIDRDQFLAIWPHLRVLARCTPADKQTIVMGVRQHTRDIVAVTGDGTNDAPALRAAHVGFAMNQGTSIAKEAADIVLLDNNFASIMSAAMWGRNVYTSITRFLQFQLTTNTVAVVTAVAGAVCTSQSPLTAVQMLWVNLLMDSLAGLALATEPPSPRLLELKPFGKDHQFLAPGSVALKNVIGQSIFQLVVMALLVFAAPGLLGIPAGDATPRGLPSLHHTIVFNAFVWMQLFNQINSRMTLNTSRPWDGLSKARLFCIIITMEAVLQVLIVQYGGMVFQTQPLDSDMWALCVGIGALSLLVHEALRFVGSTHD